jgi:hypothetical protein
MVDWFATKERALEHALEIAEALEVQAIVVANCYGHAEWVIPVQRMA